MPNGPLRYQVQMMLNQARGRTAMGRVADSAGEGGAVYPDLSTPAGQAEFFKYVIEEINALNQIVVELATEIDRLKGS